MGILALLALSASVCDTNCSKKQGPSGPSGIPGPPRPLLGGATPKCDCCARNAAQSPDTSEQSRLAGRPGSGAPAKVLVFMQLFRSPPQYVMWCGPIDLVTMSPRRLRLLPIGNGGPAAREDVMTWKFPVANKLAVLLAAGAVVAVGFDITPASAQSKPRYDDRGRP